MAPRRATSRATEIAAISVSDSSEHRDRRPVSVARSRHPQDGPVAPPGQRDVFRIYPGLRFVRRWRTALHPGLGTCAPLGRRQVEEH